MSTDHPRRDAYKRAEETAFRGRVGLWAADACGPAAGATVEIVDLVWDPPGPDDEVASEEWVELRNGGTEPVDLGGWTVRDESSRHRHRFPPATVLAPGETLRLRSGCGTDSPGETSWCAGGSVWSNGGDTAYLLDPAGNVADRFGY